MFMVSEDELTSAMGILQTCLIISPILKRNIMLQNCEDLFSINRTCVRSDFLEVIPPCYMFLRCVDTVHVKYDNV